jgi:nucleotide-binding universal stress UspA family protein
VTGVARFNEIGDFLVGTAVEQVVRHATMPVLVVKQRAHTPSNSILVATDYSSCSRQALLVVAKMLPDAMLHLVHAYHVPFEGFLRSDEIKQEITEAAQRELAAFLHDPAIPDTVRQRIRPHLSYGS